jgi:hypothetical protein
LAWEWLAPTGTVLGAGITAGLGGWLGSRHTRTTQQRQHDFDRKKVVDERGRAKADEAVTALRFLGRHTEEVAEWSTASPAGELTLAQLELDRLAQAIDYLTDDVVRQQMQAVHDVIAESDVAFRYGSHDYGSPRAMIWRACREGVEILGRYVRNQPSQAPSKHLAALQKAYDSGHEEMVWQHEQMMEYAKEQRRAQRKREAE